MDNYKNIDYTPKAIESHKTYGVFSGIGRQFNGNLIFNAWSLLRITFFILLFIWVFRWLNYSSLQSVSFTDLLEFMADTTRQGNLNWITEDVTLWRIPVDLANTAFGESLINVLNFILSPITAIIFLCQRLIFVLWYLLQFIGFVVLGI